MRWGLLSIVSGILYLGLCAVLINSVHQKMEQKGTAYVETPAELEASTVFNNEHGILGAGEEFAFNKEDFDKLVIAAQVGNWPDVEAQLLRDKALLKTSAPMKVFVQQTRDSDGTCCVKFESGPYKGQTGWTYNCLIKKK